MKFGITFANTGHLSEPAVATEFAKVAESLGFESLWASQHVVIPADHVSPCPYTQTGRMPGGDDVLIPDPLVWLGYIAAATDTIRLATGTIIVPLLNPVVLAKQLATLDYLSGGRLEFGIGLGWLKEEFEAIGVPFEDRGARADEYISAMRALWTHPVASHHGKYINFDNCILRPSPAQQSIPIHIGGNSVAAARRAGSFGDGFLPMTRDTTTLKSLSIEMRNAAIAVDRDLDDIEITVTTTLIGRHALPEIDILQGLGVTRILVPAGLFLDDPVSGVQKYHANVVAPFNGH
ncbi:LLM class F420-dependent oxidoreductase [Rhodococcus erythropolis]|uniref:LLM class F420-dependent oxidoreductase n=1 Tax=Rhodococcus erythropolis TaxID=1833 RepID=A0AAX4A0A7_RHOER|nr:LLM class F420-dependent oxidoreductase [Rhodococcus erythropolis]WMN02134.1 LLM class F420-dependent oxidoreductase [Rhodococcus erythropolis]WMN03109.1 LLM class F420-dependent oxidoreductase [Rhodococcus erythropolis]